MKLKSKVAAVAAAVTLAISTGGVAQAGHSQAARCSPAYDGPDKLGWLVMAEARYICHDGVIADGIPNLAEKIVGMGIEAELQSYNYMVQDWVTRDQAHDDAARAGTVEARLAARCYGNRQTLWRVKIVWAFGRENAIVSTPGFGFNMHQVYNHNFPAVYLDCA